MHPDRGLRTAEETARLEQLLAAHEAYDEEVARGETAPTDPWEDDWVETTAASDTPNDAGRDQEVPTAAEPVRPPWFVPSPEGPTPRPGFWSNPSMPGSNDQDTKKTRARSRLL